MNGKIRTFTGLVWMVLSLLLVGFISAETVGAATFTVANTNDSGAGSLRQAIIAANASPDASSNVYFAGGVSGTITLTSGQLTIVKSISIMGPGADVLAVSGNDASCVFYAAIGSTLRISGLTILNGNALLGAGILNYGSLKVADTVFTNNTAGSAGGALYLDAAYDDMGSTVITGSTFLGNSAVNGGGAILTSMGNVTITDCTFSGNSANYGSVIHTGNTGTLTIRNSTFTNNTASSQGAVSASYASNVVTLMNNTFSGNQSADASSLYIAPDVTVNAINNIFANGIGAGHCNKAITGTNSHNLDYGGAGTLNSCGAAYTGDPKLGALADNGGPTQTMALGAGSAALDAADAGVFPTSDQRGWPRPAGSAADIGAVEYMDGVLLTVEKTGTGTGRVSSLPGGIDCGINCSAASALFPLNGTVLFSAIPAGLSIFAGGTGAGCGSEMVADTPKTCGAIFTLCVGNPVTTVLTGFSSISAAIAAYSGGSGQVGLDITASNRIEDLVFDSAVNFSLYGGHNCAFTDVTGVTYISGGVTISDGSVTMDRIVIL